MASFIVKTEGPRIQAFYTDNYGNTFNSKVLIGAVATHTQELYAYIKSLVSAENDKFYNTEMQKRDSKFSQKQLSDMYNKKLSDYDNAYKSYIKSTKVVPNPNDITSLQFFSEDGIITEEAFGLKIDNKTGQWNAEQFENPTEYLKRFAQFEDSVYMLNRCVFKNGIKFEMHDGAFTLSSTENESSFDKTGTIPTKKQKCPYCGKYVDQLLKNGYCSKTCATKYRAEKARDKVSKKAEKTLATIRLIQEKLNMMDAALNLITGLPEFIRGKVILPLEYREYVTLRIDALFLQIKVIINNLMIAKNDLLLDLLRKVKFGTLDGVMQNIFLQITQMLSVVAQMQKAFNESMNHIITMLNNPFMGIHPQSYGWLMTAKSAQNPLTAGRLFVEIIPKTNIALMSPNWTNIMDYEKIESIIRAAFPPIQDVEYFLDPTAFKVRYLLSSENVPRIKKMFQMLEGIVVQGADTFPRYKRLSLKNIWFVLSILTGWGPISRSVFGDFIFHGPL